MLVIACSGGGSPLVTERSTKWVARSRPSSSNGLRPSIKTPEASTVSNRRMYPRPPTDERAGASDVCRSMMNP
jgi:hypothetical protein